MKKNSVLAAVTLLAMTAVAHAADKANMPFSQSSGEPIDITADRLDVLQAENKAIFTGNVVAIQGDVRLTSGKMVVHYKQQQNGARGEQSSIDKIEVEKDVFLATPLETASGASGLYDVANKKITLISDVVLTKDKNTLKGDKLVYDFNSGKSTLTSGGGDAAGKGRVRALFIPENDDKKKK